MQRKVDKCVAMLLAFSFVISLASMGLTNEVKAIEGYVAMYNTRSMTFSAWNGQVPEPTSAGRWGYGMTGFGVWIPGLPAGASVQYSGYVATQGWTGIQSNGADLVAPFAFFTSLRINLVNFPNWSIHYKVNVVGQGWSPLVRNNEEAGIPLSGNAIDAVKIIITPTGRYAADGGLETRTFTLLRSGPTALTPEWGTIIQNAASSWNNATAGTNTAGTNITVTNSGFSPHVIQVVSFPNDDRFGWTIKNPNGNVFTTFSEIRINEGYIAQFSSWGSTNYGFFRRSEVAHQIGHLLWLGNSSLTNSLMNHWRNRNQLFEPQAHDITNVRNAYNV